MRTVVQQSSTGPNIPPTHTHPPVFNTEDTTVSGKTFLLADDILIYGVGRREAKDKSSDCNHDDTEDHEPMPAAIDREIH